MGFDWGVSVFVEYNQPLKVNGIFAFELMLTSLLLFNKNASTVRPRALAARELGQDVRQTRSATAGTEKCDDDDEDMRAPDPQDIPEGERRNFYINELSLNNTESFFLRRGRQTMVVRGRTLYIDLQS